MGIRGMAAPSVRRAVVAGRAAIAARQRGQSGLTLWACRTVLLGNLFFPAWACAGEATSNSLSADHFRSDEYRALWALDAIGAAHAYALGYTGKGVPIAVLDDGNTLRHREFTGRVIPSARPGSPLFADWHGTELSGVLAAAKDGQGMHGVAYDADLLPIFMPEDISVSPFVIRDAVDRGGKIINASYAPIVYPPFLNVHGRLNLKFTEQIRQTLHFNSGKGSLQFFSENAQALRYAAAHDVVTVLPAGNEYGEHPVAASHPAGFGLLPYIKPAHHAAGVYRIVDGELDLTAESIGVEDYVSLDPKDSRLQGFDFSDLEGTLITAVAVGPDKRIASYSNRCGVAWRWCLAAPGGEYPREDQSWASMGMYTTDLEGGYTAEDIVGTSLAVPMVAGSAAVLRQAFPYMTARQIVELLLTSADRTGHLADRAIYGRGMLDLGRAVKGPVEFGAEGFKPIFDIDTQGYDSWWGNDIGGVGGLTKRGAGLLLMTGNNTYTGPTTVKGGTLAVVGSNARSTLTVERGGTLAGTGTVGHTTVSGTVAPGNPGAALRVDGDYVQRTEGVYVAGIAADGVASDRIHVQGRARIEDAVLQVQGIGPKAVNREYTVLQADGGIEGGYAKVADPYVFLDLDLDLDLEQGLRSNDPTRYRFSVRRNATPFVTAARTANQRAVARALETAGAGFGPHDSTLMATRTDELARRFDLWSGEAHAGTMSALSMQSGQIRDSVLGRARAMGERDAGGKGAASGRRGAVGEEGAMAEAGDSSSRSGMVYGQSPTVVREGSGKAIWARYTGARERLAGDGNAAGLSASGSGVLFGTDMPLSGHARDGVRLGVMAGFANGSVRIRDRGLASKVDSYTLGVYGDANFGSSVRLRYGASYTWHTLSARRDTVGLDMAKSHYRANTAQVFIETGRPYSLGRASIEPYAGLAYVDTRRRAFDESGNAGLHAAAARQQLGFSTLGWRGATGWELKDGSQLALYGGTGWRHAYGQIKPSARMRFSEGDSFQVQGTSMVRDAMLLEAGINVESDRGMRFGLDYTGQLAHGAQSHAVMANVSWAF